ncbi:hypothetical protein Ddye_014336 [Dipteronia dyeriana]|uniref:Uncharacterized protein n=1 Tax=Dipteronia dyeriana TaxID=168575 RepID=A0AAD9X7U5_9ROSI|nr:hypothetical protein Ddye_014336 [Dipteronia dyeriana]
MRSKYTELFRVKSPMSIFFLCIFIFNLSFQSDSTGTNVCGASDHPAYCPVKCFRADPVCGDDGVTYWCGCGEAWCAGANVANMGFCEVRKNGGAASLSAQVLLLVHIVWLIIVGFSVLFGLF